MPLGLYMPGNGGGGIFGESAFEKSKDAKRWSRGLNYTSIVINEDMTSKTSACCGSAVRKEVNNQKIDCKQRLNQGTLICTNPDCASHRTARRDPSSSVLMIITGICRGLGLVPPCFQRQRFQPHLDKVATLDLLLKELKKFKNSFLSIADEKETLKR